MTRVSSRYACSQPAANPAAATVVANRDLLGLVMTSVNPLSKLGGFDNGAIGRLADLEARQGL